MARLAELEYAEQKKRDKELHDRLLAEHSNERYQRHYNMCAEILGAMVDFSSKVGEYRVLTNRFVW